MVVVAIRLVDEGSLSRRLQITLVNALCVRSAVRWDTQPSNATTASTATIKALMVLKLLKPFHPFKSQTRQDAIGTQTLELRLTSRMMLLTFRARIHTTVMTQ